MSAVRATVYGADRAGNTWTVGEYYEPLTALWVLEAQSKLHPNCAFGVYDTDDPERGDIQGDLEDLLEFDQQYLEIISQAVEVTKNAKA